MRLLRPLALKDPADMTRLCARWLTDELGCEIVEYRIGNQFTGSIDILAVCGPMVYLVTVDTGGLGEALLGSITGYVWFMENRPFLDRIYGSASISLMGEPVVLLLSDAFPGHIRRVLDGALKVRFRLFRYSLMGTEEDPVLCVNELQNIDGAQVYEGDDPEALIRSLDMEDAGLSEGEVRAFLAAMRAP
jgi:hypothetical protein